MLLQYKELYKFIGYKAEWETYIYMTTISFTPGQKNQSHDIHSG